MYYFKRLFLYSVIQQKQTKESSSFAEKQLESEMISAKHRYLEVLEQLKMAEKVCLSNKFI